MCPKTMRAVRITGHGGPEVLELAEVAVPAPQAGEVLVRVGAVALNNTDLWTREGAYGRPGDPEALSGWRGPIDFPRIQGADVAGRVVAVGAGVDAEPRRTPGGRRPGDLRRAKGRTRTRWA